VLGFFFRETMRGNYYLLETPLVERALEFTLKVETRKLRQFLRTRTCSIAGDVTAEGIAKKAKLEGTLAFRERRLPYDFSFKGDVVRFDLRSDTASFLKSFRLQLAR
jgi:hypothetical protein